MTHSGPQGAAAEKRSAPLEELARLHGLQTSYVDAYGEVREASSAALVGVLHSLGAALESEADAGEALRLRASELADALSEPVVVAWEGEAIRIPLGSRGSADVGYRATLLHEDGGEVRVLEGNVAGLALATSEGGENRGRRTLVFDDDLPTGIHSVRLEVAGRAAEVAVFRAPRKAWAPEKARHWGLFVPTYGLRSERSAGAGDLTDLERLVQWTAGLGGDCVATLPLLAAYLDEPFASSPYSPASRLFWNELYLDPERLPELQRSPAAHELLASPEYRREGEELRRAPMVEYRRAMRHKRALLQELARTFFAGSQEHGAFEAYLRSHPRAEDYARFRATLEHLRVPWPQWPTRLRLGELRPGDYDEDDRRTHVYAQWRTQEQLERLGLEARALGLGLYLDLPLGVHADSYDTWRMPEFFLSGCSAGAPPDALFTGGQSWGLAPMHPEKARRGAYRGLVEAVRHHLACAGALRIDHVMALHRLYCIPEGIEGREGVYVGYRADELYALLSIESHRAKSLLIGEDLGTVPPEVRTRMEAHGIRRMHVLQYALQEGGEIEPPETGVCASLNTHDMPSFAGWWEGNDIEVRRELGLASEEDTQREHAARRSLVESVRDGLVRDGLAPTADLLEVLRALLLEYAASPAGLMMVSLEDLWLEREPQNVPGTGDERNNWRRRLGHSLEEAAALPEIRAILEALSTARNEEA